MSILNDTKKALSLPAENTEFDQELIMFINTAFATLQQLGLGPETGFSITGPNEDWSEFYTDALVQDLRTYVYLRVRLLFDPPTIGSVASSFAEQIKELEWRLNVKRECSHYQP